MYRQLGSFVFAIVVWGSLAQFAAAQMVTVSTAFGNGADIELTENGGAAGAATAGGNGTKPNMNARWNFANVDPAVPDKNEWAAVRFDLSGQPDKSMLTSVSLNFYMHRANTNNNKNLHFYALAPGVTGEDWDEAATTYATMPGFTFDSDSTTNLLDTAGGTIVDLGAFSTTGAELEGALATVTLPSLTTFVQGLGSHNLMTILMTTNGSTNGQWRALTKEATGSETGVITGDAGAFAPFLKMNTLVANGLAGDYNGDHQVDAADYTVWRDNLGAPTESSLHGNGDGANGVDANDYTRWKNNFGMSGGSGAVAVGASVPEPATLLLLLAAACGATSLVRFRR